MFKVSPLDKNQRRKKKKSLARRLKSNRIFYARVFLGVWMLAGLGGYLYMSRNSGASKIVNSIEANRPTKSRASDSSASDSRASDPPRDHETLLATGTREELLDLLTESEDEQDGTIAFLNYQRHTRRAALAKRLLEMELKPSDRIFAARNYLDALRIADFINLKSTLGMKDTRRNVLAAAEEYEDDTNQAIASLANLTLVVLPINDFLTTKDPKKLELIKVQFDQRDKQIFQNSYVARYFANVSAYLKIVKGFESTTEPLLKHILNRYEQETSREIVQITASFRENITFGGLDLDTLAERVEYRRPESADQVQKLFDGLSNHPDVRPKIYQFAIATVKAYWKLDEKEKAAALGKQLEEITMKITDDETRNAVLAEIKELHKKLKGRGRQGF